MKVIIINPFMEVKSHIESLKGMPMEKDKLEISLKAEIDDLIKEMNDYKVQDTVMLLKMALNYEKAICSHVLPEVCIQNKAHLYHSVT